MEILEVKNLSKVYGNKIVFSALDNISFTIEGGDFVGIMGPSGSGKTTLLNMVSTVDKPTSGEIRIKDKNPLKLKGDNLALFRRRELGFVFQDFNLLDTLTVGENIVLPLTLDGISVKYQDEELNRISKILGIEELINKRTFEISGGEAQRTAIARALIHSPTLLLADEPTGNLDSKAAKTVMELLKKINQQEKVTTMMVTHDPLSASYCSRILFIKDGAIYNEIYRGDSRQKFYQEIIDVLALLGGETNEF
ncbi:peptide ABC transporter, Pep4E family, ATP-binding protein [Clostridium pasteurianum DSM 525 = ATCC 6013]|uniref:Peptide ABC transporter, Pep4E family, ATP-binding protein n=1 Tax=Clostridium pasteurianum DSM 525 = ATCC 6013 TaxID=1262449 RepID=A0A0H3IZV1_CLOPA|nr:ABC transporter ATP-binding protein [Clostridium pasteurianum]AJA47081.1 peptide ABC transporter, Pep4E family, ATP-binding protein [Clostridium pasteurianum DSM 525 = ATCC 6013]AJA51069.1 peptide ABC transporter, Pep4E family, ATP-binding protein [Clostridium pasteurianum DSM 525 = ATCC 6013]AOZ74444.1 bacitracin ABC transporter ATP-binding protein [Clostridium pasteurianum DSM 525 = ATCC 6013]AOZ78241.1 bacitracin ABC transporter ATP-binding protein [Clostridium pasteurianum]ELP59531.1 pe